MNNKNYRQEENKKKKRRKKVWTICFLDKGQKSLQWARIFFFLKIQLQEKRIRKKG
jgi:hypothetical protein